MSQNEQLGAGASEVSPARKKASVVILAVLLVVLAIEVRASVASTRAVDALKVRAPDGAFDFFTARHEDIRALLTMSPSETLVRESEDEMEYRYNWLSVLRPVLGKPEAAVYIVVSRYPEGMVTRFGTEAPSEKELNPPPRPVQIDGEGDAGMIPMQGSGRRRQGPDGESGPDSESPAARRRPPVDESVPTAEPDSAGSSPEDKTVSDSPATPTEATSNAISADSADVKDN